MINSCTVIAANMDNIRDIHTYSFSELRILIILLLYVL